MTLPYPTKYITSWKLSDGTEVILRPIKPEDEPAEQEMLSSSSEETLRTRFFTGIKDIPHEWLVRFCNIDYDRHIAIIAELQEKGKKKEIGVARIVINQEMTSGDVAVLVQDRFQGKGLGFKLLEVLIGIARERGLENVRAEFLTENERMVSIFKRLGFTTRWVEGDMSEAILKLK